MSLKRQLDMPEKFIPDNKMKRFDVRRDEADTAPERSAEQPAAVPMKEVDKWSDSTTTNLVAMLGERLLSIPKRQMQIPHHDGLVKFTSRLESQLISLEQHMEALVVEKQEKINQKVKANEETISACTIQVKKLKLEKEALVSKLDDLENHSRKTTWYFTESPESPRENSQKLVENLIPDFEFSHHLMFPRSPSNIAIAHQRFQGQIQKLQDLRQLCKLHSLLMLQGNMSARHVSPSSKGTLSRVAKSTFQRTFLKVSGRTEKRQARPNQITEKRGQEVLFEIPGNDGL